MKSWTVQMYFVVVVLVATSLFIRLPVSSASSTIQADTTRFFGLSTELDTEDTDKKKKKKRFFGLNENNEESVDTEDTDKKKKPFFGSSFKPENKGESDDTEDTDTDKKQKQKEPSSSWQFFNRNKESNDASGGEGDGDGDEAKTSPTSTEKDENKKRFQFQFQFRRREKELDEKDPKKNKHDEVREKVNEEVNEELDSEDKNEQGEAKKSEKVEENDSESSSSSDKVEDDDKSDSQTTIKDDPQSDQDEEGKKDEDKENNSQQAAQQYRNQLMLKQQLAQSPGAIFYRPAQLPQQGFPQQQQPSSPSAIPSAQGQIMAASAIVNVLGLVSRFFFIKWIINKLAFESESMSPTQHFMWECLNDKFVKDNEIWNRVLGRVPHSMNVSQRKWGNTVKAMGPDKINLNKKQQNMIVREEDQVEQQQWTEIPETSKTVVVMDFSTMNVPDPDFLRFADVVTFLVGSNNPRKLLFGKKPEVIIILQSPGGEVTSFAFAAAQVARLRSAGWKVTISVDRIAASGGYMIASQATQILASPFAMVGSIGVITETLNFYETLKKYGVKSLVLKAGDMKNPITQYGEVSEEDIQNTQEDLEEIHESFINLCRLRRPALDLEVCNGRVLSGERALEKGMIDRILTSDEYIMEKISEGDLVMKLHLVSGRNEHNMIARALELLPHLSSKFKRFISTSGGTTGSGINAAAVVGRRNASTSMIQMDGNAANKVVQVVGLACMIQRAIARTGFFDSSKPQF